MAGPRNKTAPKQAGHPAAAQAVAEAVEASLGEPAPGVKSAAGDGISPPPPSVEATPNEGELPAPEKEGVAEAEARKLKELNAMLLKEVYERRGQVASLSGRVEELSITTVTEDAPDAVAEPKKKVVKKKAPVRSVQARMKAVKIPTATTNAPADEQGGKAAEEPEAGPAPGGRPRRNRKANSMYPADTWAR